MTGIKFLNPIMSLLETLYTIVVLPTPGGPIRRNAGCDRVFSHFSIASSISG